GGWLSFNGRFELLQGTRIFDGKLGDARTAQRLQVRATTEALAEVMRQRPHVRSGAYAGAKAGAIAVESHDRQLADFDLDGLQFEVLVLAGQLVGWHALNFFRRKTRRHLLDFAGEAGSRGAQLAQVELDGKDGADRIAIGIVGVRRKTEADDAFIGFLRLCVELTESREVADGERQHARRQGIERPQVSHGT